MTDVITDPRFWALHAAATQLWDALAEYRRAWETGLAMHQGEYDMRRMWQSRAEEYENDTIGLRDEVKALRSALSASEARCERMRGALAKLHELALIAKDRGFDPNSGVVIEACRAALSADAAEEKPKEQRRGQTPKAAAYERERLERLVEASKPMTPIATAGEEFPFSGISLALGLTAAASREAVELSVKKLVLQRLEESKRADQLESRLASQQAELEKAASAFAALQAGFEDVNSARLRIETVAVKERLEKQRLARELRDVRVELAESRAAMQELDTEATKALEELGRVKAAAKKLVEACARGNPERYEYPMNKVLEAIGEKGPNR